MVATFASVQDYGAVGNGTTDDTTAFNNALAANKVVYVPALRYAVGNVVVNSGNTLFGYMGGPIYDSVDSTRDKPMLVPKAGMIVGDAILDVHLAVGFGIIGLGIDGISRVADGISDAGTLGTIHRCSVVRCNRGLGGNKGGAYSNIMRISQSVFSNCKTGVRNLIDSVMTDCATSTNQDDGVQMQGGASSNNINSHRSEWNSGYGFSLDAVEQVQINGGLTDSNSSAGIRLNNCAGVQITGHAFRGNGASNVTLDGVGRVADSHLYMNGSSHIVINGCDTRIYSTPKYSIKYGASNKNIVLGSNILSGVTVQAIIGPDPVNYSLYGNQMGASP